MKLSEATIKNLVRIASRNTWSDEMKEDPYPMIHEYAGGNIDDAYYEGQDVGETLLAREILDELGIEYKVSK